MSKAKPELKLVEDTGSQLQDEDLSIELPPQQSEMPFAVVEGEPMTQLPRDLYIPPDALQVFLTAFEGPLDLLLYLIRKQNLDILNIPIAEITRQYMKYIDVMAELQLELAGEYLLMAAMLAEIKSRMLLPRPASAEGTDEDDPRAELVRRLQEYERFKKAAEDLDKLNRLERDNVTASAELEERKIVKLQPDVTLKEMLDAFRDVLSRAEKFAHHHISRERLSQRERMTEILARLQTVAFFEFAQLFKVEEGRMGVTVTFIAILELMKEGLIEIVQAEAYAPIHVRTAQRHLKVVQGGPAASETADAENAAALAQPELAGENDIPDEDDTPPADEAAVAVEAAVADVAAASSIAADSVESDGVVADAGFVDAVVSEAMASTENAVETVAEVAATDEAAIAAVVAEEVAAGSPVVVDEAAAFESPVVIDAAEVESPVQEIAVDAAVIESAAADLAARELTVNAHVYDEVTLEDVPHEFATVDPAVADETDPLEAQVVEPVLEHAAELSVSPVFDVLSHDSLAHAAVIEGTAAAAPESDATFVSIYSSESVESTSDETTSPVDAVAGESFDAVVSESIDAVVAADEHMAEEHAFAADEHVAEEHVVAVDEHVVEEHIVEGHEVEEHVVPEHVVEEHIVPTSTVVEENASLVAFVETADVVEEAQPETAEVIDEPTEIADEPVASSDFTATDVVDEHAQLAATTDVGETEPTAQVEAVAQPALEAIEVAVEGVPADETTNVLIEDAATAEQTETTGEQVANLSDPDLSNTGDSVTGASDEADNSDAEPTR